MAHGGCQPEPGDLIEMDRILYQHWALYLGDGYVIHVTGVGSSDITLSVSSVSNITGVATVKKELLKEVVENIKWRVNNKYDHLYPPFPVEEIIQRAESWIDKEVSYRLFGNNCEHFVTMLRYGEGVSDQVSPGALGITALLGITYIPHVVMVRYTLFCVSFYKWCLRLASARTRERERAADGLSGRAQTEAGGAPGHSGHWSAFDTPAIKTD